MSHEAWTLRIRQVIQPIGYSFGVVAMTLRLYRMATWFFEGVLATDPRHIGALHHSAWLLTRLNEFEGALSKYQLLASLVPNDSNTAFALGTVLQRLNRNEEAVEAFDVALEGDPLNTQVLYNLAESLLAIGRLQDALTLYRRVSRLEPENADAIGNLGATLGRLGHWNDALEWQQRAFSLRPSEVHAYNLAVTLAELGR